MNEKFWTITEIMKSFQIEERFLIDLEDEEIICPICEKGSSTKLLSDGDLEKLRLAKILMEDMGVNLAGIEVIIHMRQNMIKMRNQFDTILEDLASRFRAYREDS